MRENPVRIVSRSSPMALAQAERVRGGLGALFPGIRAEILPVTTSGDRWSGALNRIGGKGAFTKEVDAALLSGEADLAVHCLKDVPGDLPLPEGTVFAAYLARDDVRDALVHPGGLTLDGSPPGTRIGTSSVRRTAQLAASHPHLACVPIRGNVNRRLARLDAGEFDALLLAVSGLRRIGREDRITQALPLDVMCPPIGAGVLVLQCRADDEPTLKAATALDDPAARVESTAERAFLRTLRGHCNSPIAGHAHAYPDGGLSMSARVFTLDGKTVLDAYARTSRSSPGPLGVTVADALLEQGARELLDSIPH